LEEALAVRSAYHVSETCRRMALSSASESEKTNTHFGVEIVQMSRAHIMYLSFKLFKDTIEQTKFMCQKLKENLKLMCILNGLYELSQDSVANFETGYF
jgi:hypothetical protein